MGDLINLCVRVSDKILFVCPHFFAVFREVLACEREKTLYGPQNAHCYNRVFLSSSFITLFIVIVVIVIVVIVVIVIVIVIMIYLLFLLFMALIVITYVIMIMTQITISMMVIRTDLRWEREGCEVRTVIAIMMITVIVILDS